MDAYIQVHIYVLDVNVCMCTFVSICVNMFMLIFLACEHFCLFCQSDNCLLPAMYEVEAF